MTDEESNNLRISFIRKMIHMEIETINIAECNEMIDACNIIKRKIELDARRS